MKIAVCDDEEDILLQMKAILQECGYEADFYLSSNELIKKTYDVYFLDIGIKGLNGIEAGKIIRERNPHSMIVYLTNFDDYQIQAFGVHAFDYLKKPPEINKIIKVIQDIKKYHAQPNPHISFKTKQGTLQLAIDEILYFEFYTRKVLLHTKDKQYELSSSLHSIAEKMQAYHFVMPHKSFCVNLAGIRLLKGYDITMLNGDCIPLSQKKSQQFREALNDYLYHKVTDGSL